jgi:hypothetical protein
VENTEAPLEQLAGEPGKQVPAAYRSVLEPDRMAQEYWGAQVPAWELARSEVLRPPIGWAADSQGWGRGRNGALAVLAAVEPGRPGSQAAEPSRWANSFAAFALKAAPARSAASSGCFPDPQTLPGSAAVAAWREHHEVVAKLCCARRESCQAMQEPRFHHELPGSPDPASAPNEQDLSAWRVRLPRQVFEARHHSERPRGATPCSRHYSVRLHPKRG